MKVAIEHKPDSCDLQAGVGDLVSVLCTATLENKSGVKLDHSLHRDEPFKFQLGFGQVRSVDETNLKNSISCLQIQL
jgi:FKBP-type peptidyl-prolyl cis-trans isomerase